MANREKGEVSFQINGTSYTLCLDIDAMCRIEEQFSTPERDVTFQDVLERVNAGSMRHIRAVLHSMFFKHHPTFTEADLSEAIASWGGLQPFVSKALEAVGLGAVPDPKDLKKAGVNGNPPRAQRKHDGAGGTGTVSTGTGGASV